MSTYTIRDIAIGRTLGTVEATSERGARIKASREFNTGYTFLSAVEEAHPAIDTTGDLDPSTVECRECGQSFGLARDWEESGMAAWHAHGATCPAHTREEEEREA